MSLGNGLGRLKSAVMTLAVQDKPLEDRLEEACAEIRRIDPEKDLPPDLRATFAELTRRIQSCQGSGFPPEDRRSLAALMVDMLGKFIAFTWQYE
jgi:hypothetical protein